MDVFSVRVLDILCDLIESRHFSHGDASEYLRRIFHTSRGFSKRTVRRLCAKNKIGRRSNLEEVDLERLIRVSVSKVGRHYGRKMMTGLLSSRGWTVGENRVGRSLKRVNPGYHHSRTVETNVRMNPVPYIANYFGHKIHLDQNEKIAMFGVTHILAVDGYSGKIISLVSMPAKNCALIYEYVYMKMTNEFGLWDTVRVDHGTEWALVLYIQNLLSNHRNDQSLRPYLQTSSRQNHVVERLWVEVNKRVNYPIKQSLINLAEDGQIDFESPGNKFCISWCTIHVANVGLKLLVDSWNNHPLPSRVNLGRGSPNSRISIDNRAKSVVPGVLPNCAEAIQLYRNAGGLITDRAKFGEDPLGGNDEKKQIRQDTFLQHFQFDQIFHEVVNGNDAILKDSLLFLCDITYRLSAVEMSL